jgi:hypothetical protein
MDDPYPSHFEIEIDRVSLRKYLRAKWFLSWSATLAFIGAFIGFGTAAKAIDQGLRPWTEVLSLVCRNAALGLGIGLFLAVLLYLIFSHRLAAIYASSLGLFVEGPFLRVREAFGIHSDRRLHFRAVVDYAIQQDWLMRQYSIEALKMTTTGGGQASAITILGVTGGIKTRDLLSEVDRLRENAA